MDTTVVRKVFSKDEFVSKSSIWKSNAENETVKKDYLTKLVVDGIAATLAARTIIKDGKEYLELGRQKGSIPVEQIKKNFWLYPLILVYELISAGLETNYESCKTFIDQSVTVSKKADDAADTMVNFNYKLVEVEYAVSNINGKEFIIGMYLKAFCDQYGNWLYIN